MCHVFYANSEDGNAINRLDYNDFLKEAVRKQEMPGFDEDYLDVVDYILKITHRIWEEHSVGVIYDTYHNEVRVHSCSTTGYGIRNVILHTLEDQHMFPNRKLAPQAVIWAEDEPGKYFSSHRLVSTALHLGDGSWGKATGKEVVNYAIADCYMKENRIYEEWLVRDTLAQARSMGLDPLEYVRTRPAPVKDELTIQPYSESMNGQFFPEKYVAKDDSPAELIQELHSQVFNYKSLDRICDFFTEDALMYFVGGDCLKGHDAIQGALISFLSCFASANTTVHRVTVNMNPDSSSEIAVRWVLRGLHEGYGMFGAPTNKMVEIMGINHYHMVNVKITESWMIFDALDVLKQLHGGEALAQAEEE